jgi:hypothetical protein
MHPVKADETPFDLLSDRHRARFVRWVRSVPARTQHMVTLVLTSVVDQMREHGFRGVDFALGDPEWVIEGGEIHLERRVGDDLDFVLISFGRDGALFFGILFGRRKAQPPHEWIRSGELVHRQGQRSCFWGKPWYVPAAFWSDAAMQRTVSAVRLRLPQVLTFLDTAETGPNVTASK